MNQRAPWPPRRLLVLIVLPAFALLAAVAVFTTVPSIERDLERKAVEDLSAAGFDLSTLRVSLR